MSEPATPPLQVCQIQIQPVDDGFVFQGVGIDGVRKSVKQIAADVTELRQKLHKLVDTLYELPPAKPATPTAPITEQNGGSAGTQTPP